MPRDTTYNNPGGGGRDSSSRKPKPRTLELDFEIALRLQKEFEEEDNHGKSSHKSSHVGGGESSSGKTKMQTSDSDYEIARRLQKALDDEEGQTQTGHTNHPSHKSSHTQKSLFIRKDLPMRNELFSHKEVPAHTTKSIHKDMSSRKEQPAHMNLPTRKDLFSRKEPPAHTILPAYKDPPRREDLHATSSYGKTLNSVLGRESEYPLIIQDAMNLVQKFIATAMNKTCRACNSELMSNFDVGTWYNKWIATKGQTEVSSICAVPCPKSNCAALTCLGCGQKPLIGKFRGKIDGYVLDWCCEEGRLFSVWSLLCQYDNLELNMQERYSRREPTTPKPRYSSGFGFPVDSGTGTGYATATPVYDLVHAFPNIAYDFRSGPLNFKQTDSETDSSTWRILALLIELLPHRSEKTNTITPALSAMVELSLVQDRVAELLRNDSLQDVTKRAGLYFIVFEFVERLGKHPNMSYLVSEERFTKKQSGGLYAISTNLGFKSKGKTRATEYLKLDQGNDNMAAPLITCLTNLAIQSQALVSASRAVESEFRTIAGQDILEIANRVIKLNKSINPIGNTDLTKGGLNNKHMTWEDYHRQHGVARAENMLRHMNRGMVVSAGNLSHSPPNRIKRLVTEISEMATSLPLNIFVRADEARPDVMKSLIIGPKDTPYEGGLFEFDIFCDENYPLSPPWVFFCTTAGGRLNVNPNLHANGLVCLSILNTWPGQPEERWQGAKSSIFSVLVSIQAMVFCSMPWGNEPSYEHQTNNQHGQQASQQYNKIVQGWTIRYGLLDWLHNKPQSVFWGSVLKAYFEHNGDAILNTARRWKHGNMQLGAFDERYTVNQIWKPKSSIDLVWELEKALQPFRRTGW